MIHFRHFLNTDPPHLAAIWNQQPPMRGQVKTLTHFQIEHLVLSKPYFDPAGLIFAFRANDDGSISQPETPLGFVHAAFSPNASQSDIDRSRGVICQLKLMDVDDKESVADGLIDRAVDYLASQGSRQIFGGAEFPYCPFYLGLYGGSEIPGVLEADQNFSSALERNGFDLVDTIAVLQRKLAGFRPISGREQIAIRRKYQINTVVEPTFLNWWECCIVGLAARERFSIYHKGQQTVCGNVGFWDMQPLASETVTGARGMYALNVPEAFRRSGIATFLVGEALKYCMQQGIEVVEAQTPQREDAAMGVFRKLGFEQVDRGSVFHKSL